MELVPYSHGDTAMTGVLERPVGTPRAAVVLFPTIIEPEAQRPPPADAGGERLSRDDGGLLR